MKEKDSVCALIVTYNRKDYLLECIKCLTEQTIKPDKILIFDNHSSDGTFELLLDNNFINDNKEQIFRNIYKGIEIIYYYNSFNGGGSYGFSKGIELAKKESCKYIWTMDDDVKPELNCLSILLKALKTYRICIPNRTDHNYRDKAIIYLNMKNPFKYSIKARQKVIFSDEITNDIVNVVNMPFEGPIFESNLIDEVGLPNKDLFIIFDDTDFAYRISKITNIVFVKNAILHKQIVPKKEKERVMNWKNYYGLRNQYWFDIKYGNNIIVKKLRPWLSRNDQLVRAILKRKWSNIKIIRAAYYDGTHGILGKTVEPGKEFSWKKS